MVYFYKQQSNIWVIVITNVCMDTQTFMFEDLNVLIENHYLRYKLPKVEYLQLNISVYSLLFFITLQNIYGPTYWLQSITTTFAKPDDSIHTGDGSVSTNDDCIHTAVIENNENYPSEAKTTEIQKYLQKSMQRNAHTNGNCKHDVDYVEIVTHM